MKTAASGSCHLFGYSASYSHANSAIYCTLHSTFTCNFSENTHGTRSVTIYLRIKSRERMKLESNFRPNFPPSTQSSFL